MPTGTQKKRKKQNPKRVKPSTPKKQKGGVLWFTGLSGAGKSTLSQIVGPTMRKRGIRVEVLDGDIIRTNLSKGLGFSKEDRDTNIRRIGFVSNLLARNGVWVLVAAISPYREIRDEIRKFVIKDGSDFVEVYVKCPLEVAETRDPKGLYKKARAGVITAFTGISDPYEEPNEPELVVQTALKSPEECAGQVLNFLEKYGI